MPYGQEGRQATVYQPVVGGLQPALKVFKPRFRVLPLASMANRTRGYAALPSLAPCHRIVLTPERRLRRCRGSAGSLGANTIRKSLDDSTYCAALQQLMRDAGADYDHYTGSVAPRVCTDVRLAFESAGGAFDRVARGSQVGDLRRRNIQRPELLRERA